MVLLLRGTTFEEVSLTLLLVAYLDIEAPAWSGYALEHKKQLSGPWTWMLASVIVIFILAFTFLCRLPDTAAWAFGLLVGTSMLFGGTSMIAMAVHVHSSSPSVKKTA